MYTFSENEKIQFNAIVRELENIDNLTHEILSSKLLGAPEAVQRALTQEILRLQGTALKQRTMRDTTRFLNMVEIFLIPIWSDTNLVIQEDISFELNGKRPFSNAKLFLSSHSYGLDDILNLDLNTYTSNVDQLFNLHTHLLGADPTDHQSQLNALWPKQITQATDPRSARFVIAGASILPKKLQYTLLAEKEHQLPAFATKADALSYLSKRRKRHLNTFKITHPLPWHLLAWLWARHQNIA